MIADVITWLDLELAMWHGRRPLTFDQWMQARRLAKAARLLRRYAADEQPTDDIDPDGVPR